MFLVLARELFSLNKNRGVLSGQQHSLLGTCCRAIEKKRPRLETTPNPRAPTPHWSTYLSLKGTQVRTLVSSTSSHTHPWLLPTVDHHCHGERKNNRPHRMLSQAETMLMLASGAGGSEPCR